jgi:hypothetical protein
VARLRQPLPCRVPAVAARMFPLLGCTMDVTVTGWQNLAENIWITDGSQATVPARLVNRTQARRGQRTAA